MSANWTDIATWPDAALLTAGAGAGGAGPSDEGSKRSF